MINGAIIKAKIKRSGIVFKDTRIHYDETEDCFFCQSLLYSNEELIVSYSTSHNYRWAITNMRLVLSSENRDVSFTELIDVNMQHVGEKSGSKLGNKLLILRTKNDTIDVFFEDKTWFLFFDIFKFIINKVQSQ